MAATVIAVVSLSWTFHPSPTPQAWSGVYNDLGWVLQFLCCHIGYKGEWHYKICITFIPTSSLREWALRCESRSKINQKRTKAMLSNVYVYDRYKLICHSKTLDDVIFVRQRHFKCASQQTLN